MPSATSVRRVQAAEQYADNVQNEFNTRALRLQEYAEDTVPTFEAAVLWIGWALVVLFIVSAFPQLYMWLPDMVQ